MRLIFFDIDSLRPDHLGCGGYHRNTSPNIDGIAADGVVFDEYYCSDAPCLPSRSALMSGMFGIHSGAVNHGGIHGDMRLQGESRRFRSSLALDSLPAFLKDRGAHTCYIGGFGERHAIYTFYAGFREIHDTGMLGLESAEDVTPTVLDWIERNGDKEDWYLHVNYWDPHTPHRAPKEFGNPFKNDPLPPHFNQELIDRHRKLPGPHTIQDLTMYDNRVNPNYPRQPGEIRNMEDMRALIDGYDCGVRYTDDHIGRVLNALGDRGLLDDTVIIISADHGENFGELGVYAEHGTADAVTCRVPMIIRWPRMPGGIRDTGLHYNIDLAPTLAEMMGAEPRESWDGRSFAAALKDGRDCGRDELILSQCSHVCQRSVRFDEWLYMRTYHDGYHLYPKEMLFDLEKDPFEQHNLAEENPRVCREAAYRLMEWHDAMMASMPFGYHDDPMWNVIAEGGPFHARGALKGYLPRLEATGRGDSVAELKRRHPRELE